MKHELNVTIHEKKTLDGAPNIFEKFLSFFFSHFESFILIFPVISECLVESSLLSCQVLNFSLFSNVHYSAAESNVRTNERQAQSALNWVIMRIFAQNAFHQLTQQ